MTDSREWTLDGHGGRLVARTWDDGGTPSHVVLLAHGYGEVYGRGLDIALPDFHHARQSLVRFLEGLRILSEGRWFCFQNRYDHVAHRLPLERDVTRQHFV